MAKQGDTFLLANPSVNNHLFIIISNPDLNPDQIVTANLTSWRTDKDQSCLVEIGEHRFVKSRSCVQFHQNRLITLKQYETLMRCAQITPHDPVSAGLLKRILAGAANSPYIPLGNRQVLVDQGLIDDE